MIDENFKGIDVNFVYDYIMGCLVYRDIYIVVNFCFLVKDLIFSRCRGLC